MTELPPPAGRHSYATGPSLDPLAISAHDGMRRHILETTITLLQRKGFHDASLVVVASACGITEDEIKTYFTTWEALLVATLDLWNGRRLAPLLPIAERHGAAAYLRGVIQANIADPALMRVLLSTVDIAATPTNPIARELRAQWTRFYSLVVEQLRTDITAGREPTTMQPSRGAEQLIAIYEGLQLQSMVRPDMDLLDSYDRAVTRLRDGWSRTYTPPLWNLDQD